MTISGLQNKGGKIILTSLLIGAISLAYVLFFVPSIYGQSDSKINTEELIYLTNQERSQFNLSSLSVNPLLTKAALYKAKDLLKNNYFNHNSPEGKKFSQWVKETDYQYTIVGENLAMGFSSSPAVIKAWMASDKHRENILHPKYKDIGLAVLKGKLEGITTYVIVQYFGATENLVLSELLLPYQQKIMIQTTKTAKNLFS